MSYLTFEEFLSSPTNVRRTLSERTNFLACALERECTSCGSKLTAYSTKIVNVLTGEINCGHEEMWDGDKLHHGWVMYSDG